MENNENENMRILNDFKDYLTVERRLEKGTVYKHILELRRLFKTSGFDPLVATKLEIRNYLKNFIERPANSYANILKTLRIFYRDYLGRGEIIEVFKFPNRQFKAITLPSKRELSLFYQWLKEPLAKALFLIFATTGLRRKEVLNLKIGEIDFEKRMIASGEGSRTKRTWITFYNDEAEDALKEYLGSFQGLNKDARLFPIAEKYFRIRYAAFEKERGVKISPQILREWFCCEMGRLGVQDRYVDAFCGRVPRSVLARHYTDFSPERLKEIYDKANLKVLN